MSRARSTGSARPAQSSSAVKRAMVQAFSTVSRTASRARSAVLAEPFTVVRRHEEHRGARVRTFEGGPHDAPHALVEERDFPRIERRCVAGRRSAREHRVVRARRKIGEMRVEEMDPQEKGTFARSIEHALRRARRLGGLA